MKRYVPDSLTFDVGALWQMYKPNIETADLFSAGESGVNYSGFVTIPEWLVWRPPGFCKPIVKIRGGDRVMYPVHALNLYVEAGFNIIQPCYAPPDRPYD